jgi:hypothetical protein
MKSDVILDNNLLVIFIICIILMIISNLFINKRKQNFEQMINIPYTPTIWNRNKCNFIMNKTLESEFNINNIKKNNNGWNLYLPCSYNNSEKEIENMPIINGAKYFIIDNCKFLVAKEKLWKELVNYYGFEKTCMMMPKSYDLRSIDEKKRFINEYNINKIYIMKKNIQQQKGLKITKNKFDIINGYKENYILAQELLQNPYLINGRKINLRCYILVVCHKGEINVYVHKDGFMYYTKEKFIKNSLNMDVNITTGYIDREIYKVNPLTHDDFRNYLDNNNNLSKKENIIKNNGLKISEVCFNNIYSLIKNIFIAFIGKICVNKKFINNITFQLFGADIAIDDGLNPMIMEINKGPDMNAKDIRDSNLKHGVVQDILRIVGSVDNNKFSRPNGFKLVLESINNI